MPRTAAALSMLSVLSGLAMELVGCGGTEGPPPTREVATPTTGGTETGTSAGDTPAPPDPRALGISARFGDLVRAARAVDDTNQAESAEGCVLRGDGPYRLTADVAVAIRPLPEAPEDLDARLRDATSARLFTRWGQVPRVPAPEAIAVVGITGTPPPARTEGAAIFVTDEGIYVRPAGFGAAHGPLSFTDGAGAARATVSGSGMTLVAAEAGVSLAALRDLLALLPPEAHGKVALGVTLPANVTLPDATPIADDGRGLCPDGLPAVTDDAGDPGELTGAAIVGALGPLRQGAAQCMATARGPGAAGTRVGLAMRIGADGRLTEACITNDSASDPALRDCLLEAARATVFPAPSPAGYVDAVLPLTLVPDASLTQALVCP
ncbi:MAG: hypothetical protein DRJ42_17640 [Deltaproteobacteria bacterium]|nr:MAG: hypothetical protein DRJ42_17640 [Deltaproteobacteria bacterium]